MIAEIQVSQLVSLSLSLSLLLSYSLYHIERDTGLVNIRGTNEYMNLSYIEGGREVDFVCVTGWVNLHSIIRVVLFIVSFCCFFLHFNTVLFNFIIT